MIRTSNHLKTSSEATTRIKSIRKTLLRYGEGFSVGSVGMEVASKVLKVASKHYGAASKVVKVASKTYGAANKIDKRCTLHINFLFKRK
ncbi:hypothetical protein ACTNEO_08600 [Gracilibacillus sp. HCP3S3_G5_1]|uniref:hypothetical protein n=1 Tax=Gracilibacillus sp. HCP3S3_G5_1 TaxID=3438940 RepID=UPI003F894574